MISELYVLWGTGTDPYHNLALEELLLDRICPGRCILYLWQNENTVVIGRNQNPLAECDLSAMAQDKVRLARRLSGGGAVYHDLGNLNFTLLLPRQDFDKTAQAELIRRAAERVGIPAERSGRNDLTAQGRKFSGHAYYQTGDRAFHHGTLMLSVALEKLGRYLAPSPEKLAGRGVSSVRARVVNLKDFSSELTIQALGEALTEALEERYGMPAMPFPETELDKAALEAAAARFASERWIYAGSEQLPEHLERRFPWGLVRLDYERAGTRFGRAILSTDALESPFPALELGLSGCPLNREALLARLKTLVSDPAARELLQLLEQLPGGIEDEL